MVLEVVCKAEVNPEALEEDERLAKKSSLFSLVLLSLQVECKEIIPSYEQLSLEIHLNHKNNTNIVVSNSTSRKYSFFLLS